jgi:hypothetical protein
MTWGTVNNESIRSFPDLFVGSRYLQIVDALSFAVNNKISGLGVISYHAFNLAVHLANALLL